MDERESWSATTRRGAMLAVGGGLIATATQAQARAPAPDADYRWRNVKVGGGGFIPGVIFSRAERGLAYARSDMGGAYRFDAGLDRWIPLQDGMEEGSYYGVESLAPDPVDPEVVHMAVGMSRWQPAAMLRSDDRGATWRVTPVDFRMGGNEDGRGLGERLAIDPNATDRLWFGSRHDGLQASTDGGLTWARVSGFPVRGEGLQENGTTHPGLAFVVIDPRSGAPGEGSRTLYVGVADEAGQGLYRSDDGGRTWRRVEGGPRGLSPVKAEIDTRGVLYVAFCEGVGPNGVTDGAVWRLEGDRFTDITPPKPGPGGFMGLALDRSRPGVVLTSTLNRWQPGDTLWASFDDGRSWTSLRERARHDVTATPFLYWGNDAPSFGWWIAALAIDPFDGDRAVYGTGATLYATANLTQAEHGRPTDWAPWVEGIEQTACITLASPSAGPSLLTGFGDISGFAHEDLSVSPTKQFTTPVFGNTNQITYAGRAPNIVVRSGTPHEGVGSGGHDGSTLAWSEDHGLSWKPLGRPRAVGEAEASSNPRMDLYRDAPIEVSADGSTFLMITPTVHWSADRGQSWTPVQGLPKFLRPVADRVDPELFYALDFDTGRWFVSVDGGRTFATVATRGLPADLSGDKPTWREQSFPLKAAPRRDADLWLVSRHGLYHSLDGGMSFQRIDGGLRVELLDFGRSPPGRNRPALFAVGWRDQTRGVFRSDDEGQSWIRVNDDANQWGRRFRAIAGDPRVFGRVYVATDGRGVVYGEPA